MNYEAEILGVKDAVAELQKDVTEIKTTQPFLQDMLRRNTEANEKLVATLHEVDKSMVAINDKLDTQSQDIATIKQEMDETTDRLDGKIQEVKKQVDTVDDDGKFNIRIFLKEYFPWIVVLIGVGIHALGNHISF